MTETPEAGPEPTSSPETDEQRRLDQMMKEVVEAITGKHDGRKTRREIAYEFGWKQHSFMKDGKRVSMPMWALALTKLHHLALKNKRRSRKKLLKLQETLMPQASRRGGLLIVPKAPSIEEWIRRYAFPEDLAKLTDEQIKNIK